MVQFHLRDVLSKHSPPIDSEMDVMRPPRIKYSCQHVRREPWPRNCRGALVEQTNSGTTHGAAGGGMESERMAPVAASTANSREARWKPGDSEWLLTEMTMHGYASCVRSILFRISKVAIWRVVVWRDRGCSREQNALKRGPQVSY